MWDKTLVCDTFINAPWLFKNGKEGQFVRVHTQSTRTTNRANNKTLTFFSSLFTLVIFTALFFSIISLSSLGASATPGQACCSSMECSNYPSEICVGAVCPIQISVVAGSTRFMGDGAIIGAGAGLPVEQIPSFGKGGAQALQFSGQLGGQFDHAQDVVQSSYLHSYQSFDGVGGAFLPGDFTASSEGVCITVSACGNGVIDAGEQCDDGNTFGGDGCSGLCQLETTCSLAGQPHWEVQHAGLCDVSLIKLHENYFELSSAACTSWEQYTLAKTDHASGNFDARIDFDAVLIQGAASDRYAAPLRLEVEGADGKGVIHRAHLDIGTYGPESNNLHFHAFYINDVSAYQAARSAGQSTAPYITYASAPLGGTTGQIRIMRTGSQISFMTIDAQGTTDELLRVVSGFQGDATLRIGTVRSRTPQEWQNAPLQSVNSPATMVRFYYEIQHQGCDCSYCGDNILQPSEQCEDGNGLGGDGCSATCRLETSCPYPEYPGLIKTKTIYQSGSFEPEVCPTGYSIGTQAIVLHQRLITRPSVVTQATLCVRNDILPSQLYLAVEGRGQNSYVGQQDCGGDLELSSVYSYGCATCDDSIRLRLCADQPYMMSLQQMSAPWGGNVAEEQMTCSAPNNLGIVPSSCLEYYPGGIAGNNCVNRLKACYGGSCATCGDGSVGAGEQCDFGAPNPLCDNLCQWTQTTFISAAQVCQIPAVCGDDDGICPEDFYDPVLGRAVSCADSGVRDVDCMRGSIAALFAGDGINYVQSVSNSHGTINIASQTIQRGNYVANFVVEGPSTPVSTTTITFTFAQAPSIVLFDNQALLSCELSVAPCFSFSGSELTVMHGLSIHIITVLFERDGISILPYLLVIALLTLIPVFVIAAKRQQYLQDIDLYLDQMEHQVNVPHGELHKLHEYIEKKLHVGVPRETVRMSLLKTGWEPHVVDLVMHNHHAPHQDLGRLRIYIEKMRAAKQDDQQIRRLLKSRGWDETVIDSMMHK